MSHTRIPWTDILAANWQNTPQTVVLTDLSRREAYHPWG